jgi:hypothetical protein
MRMRVVRLPLFVVVLVAAAVLPSVAGGAVPRSIVANLDADRALERVVLRGTPGAGYRVFLVDDCRGRPVSHPVTRRWDDFWRLEVRELDGVTGRPEVFIGGTMGNTGGDQLWAIVRSRGGCAKPRTLFRYRTDGEFLVPPTYWVLESYVEPADYLPNVPGTELRLFQILWQERDGCLSCASHERRAYFLYLPALGRYSMYWLSPVERGPRD